MPGLGIVAAAVALAASSWVGIIAAAGRPGSEVIEKEDRIHQAPALPTKRQELWLSHTAIEFSSHLPTIPPRHIVRAACIPHTKGRSGASKAPPTHHYLHQRDPCAPPARHALPARQALHAIISRLRWQPMPCPLADVHLPQSAVLVQPLPSTAACISAPAYSSAIRLVLINAC